MPGFGAWKVGEIHNSAALGAIQTRELSMALERLELSGALSGTTQ